MFRITGSLSFAARNYEQDEKESVTITIRTSAQKLNNINK